MNAIFLLTLRQLTGGRRTLLILVLVALPIGLAALLSATLGEDETSNSEFIDALLDGMLIGAIVPIVTMVLATAAFSNELEDRTLSFLVLKPVSRVRIVLAKLLASVAVGAPLVVLSGVVVTLLGASDIGARLVLLESEAQATAAVAVALLAGVVAYTAVFTWAGLISTRALAFALVYVFLWEGLVSSFLGGVRYLSIRGYSLAILHGLDDRSFAELSDRVIEFPASVAGAIVVTGLFCWLTVRRLSTMDVP